MVDVLSALPFAALDLEDDDEDALQGFDIALGLGFNLDDEIEEEEDLGAADSAEDEAASIMRHMDEALFGKNNGKSEEKELKEYAPRCRKRKIDEIVDYDDDDEEESEEAERTTKRMAI